MKHTRPKTAPAEAAARAARAFNPDGTRGLEPRVLQPNYIRHCFLGNYTLRLVETATDAVTYTRSTCASWRHEGPCQALRFIQDREKILNGLRNTDIDDILFVVFTLDPKDFDQQGRRSTRGEDPVEVAESNSLQIAEMHAALNESFRVLRFGPGSYYQRRRERVGIRDTLDLEAYVSTVEVQKRGWPHLNAILVGPGLGKQARDLTGKMKRQGMRDKDEVGRRVATAVLGAHILEKSGFGFTWADGAYAADTVAAYIAKLSQDKPGEPVPGEDAEQKRIAALKVRGIETAQAGEMAKLSQVPYEAKAHTRRIRFSRGFWGLPEKEAKYTGGLLNVRGEMIIAGTRAKPRRDEYREELEALFSRPTPPTDEELGVIRAREDARFATLKATPTPELSPEDFAAMVAELKAKSAVPPELDLVRTAAQTLLLSWGYTERTSGRNDAMREALDLAQGVHEKAVQKVVILERFRFRERTGTDHPRSESELFGDLLRMVPYSVVSAMRELLVDVAARRVARSSRVRVVFGDAGERYCPETGEVFPDPARK